MAYGPSSAAVYASLNNSLLSLCVVHASRARPVERAMAYGLAGAPVHDAGHPHGTHSGRNVSRDFMCWGGFLGNACCVVHCACT